VMFTNISQAVQNEKPRYKVRKKYLPMNPQTPPLITPSP
jgi:hypothetical protein